MVGPQSSKLMIGVQFPLSTPKRGKNMLKYNKYMKELGLTKKDYPFKQTRWRFGRRNNAYTWNLDIVILLELYTYLRLFVDTDLHGYPNICNSMEEWRKILWELIDSLRKVISRYQDLDLDPETEQKELTKFFTQLAEYFPRLWD